MTTHGPSMKPNAESRFFQRKTRPMTRSEINQMLHDAVIATGGIPVTEISLMPVTPAVPQDVTVSNVPRPTIKRRGTRVLWTEERVQMLRDMWSRDMRPTEISEEMRVTRNTVVGKANRMGLR